MDSSGPGTKVEIQHGAVANWITWARTPNPDTVKRIGNALSVDVEYLLTLAGHRPPDLYYDPESAEAQLLPYISAIDWSDRELEMVRTQLRFLAEVQRREHDRRKGH